MSEIARGSVADRPWGRTLAAFGLRGVTGQLALVCDGKQYEVAFVQGAVVGAMSPLGSDAAARVAMTGGLVSTTQVAELARRQAAAPEREEVELIADHLRLTPEQAMRLRRRTVAQRAARTFSAERGEFVLVEPVTLPVVAGSEIDIRTVIYLGARTNLSEARLGAELAIYGSWYRLKPEAFGDLPQYGFGELEQPILDQLLNGASLDELEATPGADLRTVRAVTYALASCNACNMQQMQAPRGATTPPPMGRPTASFTGSGISSRTGGATVPPGSASRSAHASGSGSGIAMTSAGAGASQSGPVMTRTATRAGAAPHGRSPSQPPPSSRHSEPAVPVMGEEASSAPTADTAPLTARTGTVPMARPLIAPAPPRAPTPPPATRAPAAPVPPRSARASTEPTAARAPTPVLGRAVTPTSTPLTTGRALTSTAAPAATGVGGAPASGVRPMTQLRGNVGTRPPNVADGTLRSPRNKPTTAQTEEVQRIVAARAKLVDARADHYTMLGVSPQATADDIRQAYFGVARQLHPDRLAALGVSDEGHIAHKVFSQVNTAFAVLSDPRRRREYDELLQRGGPTAVEADEDQAESSTLRALQAEDYFKRGELALKRDDHATAVAEFKRALDLTPDEADFQALHAWAVFCAAADKQSVAKQTRTALERALERAPKSIQARFYLGRVERMLGRDQVALGHFRELLDEKPNHFEAQGEVRVIEARLANGGKPGGGLFGRKR